MEPNMYAAASAGNIEEILMLRENAFQVTEENNETILHLAALSDNSTCVATILNEFPTLLDMLNSRNETALHLAAREGYSDVVKVLINRFRDLNSNEISLEGINFIRKGNVELDTALHLAIKNDHEAVVKQIVEADRNDEHSKNHDSDTPLYLAATTGRDSITKIILINCVNASMEGPHGRTALHAAVISKNTNAVFQIIDKRRDIVGRADDDGWTAFHHAASNNCTNELYWLVHYTSNTTTIKEVIAKTTVTDNMTALHIAAYKDNTYIAMELVKCCPNIYREIDNHGNHILHIAAANKNKRLIQYILGHLPDDEIYRLMTTGDKNGDTPLHLLVRVGCFIPQLIKHRSVFQLLKCKNNDKFTPVDLLYESDEIVGDQLMIKNAFEEVRGPYLYYIKLALFRFLVFCYGIFSGDSDSAFDIETIREGQLAESPVEPSKSWKKDEKFEIAKTQKVKEKVKLYRGRTNTQIIVSALIATVTFTVGFTIPGGNHDGDSGDADNGLATLSNKKAFVACMVADAIGLLFSTSSLFLYFVSSLYEDPRQVSKLITASTGFNIVSVVAMMITFITGTSAVLSHSRTLANTVTVISCIFFFLLLLLSIKWLKDQRKTESLSYHLSVSDYFL